MRRFPVQVQDSYGFEGPVISGFVLIAGIVVIGSLVARSVFADNKIENTKRHHPKGIGYTSLNHQMDLLREKTKKFSPNLVENYYEHSRVRKQRIPHQC